MNRQDLTQKPWVLAAGGCLVLLAVACVCGQVAGQTVFDTTGGFWGWVTGLFREQAGPDLTLRQALDENVEAAFRFVEPCEFRDTRGSEISSAGESEGGQGFARDLSREEVTAAVGGFLRETRLRTEDGEAWLESGEPVTVTPVGAEGAALYFSRQGATGQGAESESLEGTAQGSRFDGRYSLDRSLSTVENGQGVEAATSLSAGFTCELRRVEP